MQVVITILAALLTTKNPGIIASSANELPLTIPYCTISLMFPKDWPSSGDFISK